MNFFEINDALASTKAEYDKIIANNQVEEEMRTRVESLVEEKVVLEKNLLFDH